MKTPILLLPDAMRILYKKGIIIEDSLPVYYSILQV
jgi:hypothetical protein